MTPLFALVQRGTGTAGGGGSFPYDWSYITVLGDWDAIIQEGVRRAQSVWKPLPKRRTIIMPDGRVVKASARIDNGRELFYAGRIIPKPSTLPHPLI